MKKFDCIVTNPPYSDSSHTEGKNSLWRKWFKFDELINTGGVFAEIIPSSWMGSPPLLKNHILNDDGKVKINMTKINRDECERHFPTIGSKFSYFVYEKVPYKGNTKFHVKNIDGSIGIFENNLNDIIFKVFPRDLSSLGISILKKTLIKKDKLGIQNTTVCHANNKHKWELEKDNVYKYPIERTPNNIIYYNSPHPHQYLPKIVIPTTTYFRSMYYTENGTSQSFCYYVLKDTEDKDIVLNNINNKLFDYLNETFRYSNWNSVKLLNDIPKIPLDRKLDDNDIYQYFSLNEDEINHIEKLIRWR